MSGGVVSIFGRRVLNGQAPKIYGDGSQERSFTYVKDVVGINMLVAEAENTKGEAYNCASGISVTIEELAGLVKKQLRREDLENIYDKWTMGDIRHFNVSNEKIKKLGFEFKTPFEQGLMETLNWLKEYIGERR